ncbi:MAG TPA: signal peptidase I [Verrucomicrobiae bacterium]|nr:signal peptidase I [Verrucomicrobiae bacterium]
MDSKALRVRARKLWRKEIRPLVITILVMFAVRSSLADWNDVPSGSMKPTILEGDRVFVNKLAYDLKVPFTTLHLAEWSAPHRGDIVVFYSPKDGMRLVKRTIGLPGDVVELRDNRLLINGEQLNYKPIAEELLHDVAPMDRANSIYASEQLPGRSHLVAGIPAVPARRDFGPVHVPEGSYFMMGDNRDNSFDSRYFGVVKRERILGRATAVVASLDHGHYLKPRWDRFFSSLDR